MKIPEPKKLPSGKWFIQLRLGGRSYPITENSKTECIHKAQLIKAQHKVNPQAKIDNKDLTLRQAADRYISEKHNALSPATRRGYRNIQRNRFKSVMDTRVCDIKNWQAIVNDEAALCSAKTLKNSWGFIKSVLKYVKADPPELSLPQVPEKDEKWLDYEQILTFVDAVKGAACEIPALLALHSLRRSEMLDLQWPDIDLKKGIIHVAGATVPDETHKLIHKETNKNHSSRRDIPIMIPRLAEVLKACDRSTDRVITGCGEMPTRQINRLCDRVELPRIGLHGLRRSFASLAYHLKWDERMTMEIGGWSDPYVMHQIYIKLSKKDRFAATQSMAEFYKNANAIANEQ